MEPRRILGCYNCSNGKHRRIIFGGAGNRGAWAVFQQIFAVFHKGVVLRCTATSAGIYRYLKVLLPLNFRFIVHWTSPQNLAAYYQESGRAGRDGRRSYCRIYHSRDDLNSMNFFVKGNMAALSAKVGNKKLPKAVAEKRKQGIQFGFEKMVEYLQKESPVCRHKMLAAYFGEESLPECKTNCDVCKSPEVVKCGLAKYNEVLLWQVAILSLLFDFMAIVENIACVLKLCFWHHSTHSTSCVEYASAIPF